MQLFEQYRPKSWDQVVGQPKALATIEGLRARGLSGRAYWVQGKSGTGKTTIAELIASEVADEINIERVHAVDLTRDKLSQIARNLRYKGLGTKSGRVVIVNESHRLKKDAIGVLLDLLEGIPDSVTWIFTTTIEGNELFEEQLDAGPFSSRVTTINLAQRDLAQAFAERALMIAQAEGLDGRPIGDYVKLAKECRNNLREMLSRIEAGCMRGDA